ncbi:hypothetical protein ACF08W_34670, partial [Streptomyces sp. NPDC015144]|uniref:hypothetical protein n=1 Tax=Streptomyces sp. NPDC015144 TaxID=3364944 RepID=UPI0036F726DB
AQPGIKNCDAILERIRIPRASRSAAFAARIGDIFGRRIKFLALRAQASFFAFSLAALDAHSETCRTVFHRFPRAASCAILRAARICASVAFSGFWAKISGVSSGIICPLSGRFLE